MTRRRHHLATERATRRRREAQRLGKLFAEAVRARREHTAAQASAQAATAPPDSGHVDASASVVAVTATEDA